MEKASLGKHIVCFAYILLYSVAAAAQFKGETVAIVAERDGSFYAMTNDIRAGGEAQVAPVGINDEGKVVALTDEATFYSLCWQVGDAVTNARLYPYALTDDGTYQPNTDISLLNQEDKLRLKSGNSDKPWKFDNSLKTWVYQYSSKEKCGILLYPSLEYFKVGFTTYATSPAYDGKYPLACPKLLAPHRFRDLTTMASDFGTVCFPATVRSTDYVGATFYEIAGKETANGQLTALYLKAVKGDLVAGRPYIFCRDRESEYFTAALSGNEAEASHHNGLIGNLKDRCAVPVGMYVFPTDTKSNILPEGRAYIDPNAIENTDDLDASEVITLQVGSDILVGIDDLQAPDARARTSVSSRHDTPSYDLSGRPTRKNARGILIQKGAKTVFSR